MFSVLSLQKIVRPDCFLFAVRLYPILGECNCKLAGENTNLFYI